MATFVVGLRCKSGIATEKVGSYLLLRCNKSPVKHIATFVTTSLRNMRGIELTNLGKYLRMTSVSRLMYEIATVCHLCQSYLLNFGNELYSVVVKTVVQ
jgi:hypothetical protein